MTYEQLAAIAIPSRMRIIKALSHRRATITELSQQARMAKSTVVTHLKVLEKAELVQRDPGERKWVYHSLTPLGQRIASADPLHLVLIPGAALALAVSGAATLIWSWLRPPQQELPWGVPPVGVSPEPLPIISENVACGALLFSAGLVALVLWWRWARGASPREAPQLG